MRHLNHNKSAGKNNVSEEFLKPVEIELTTRIWKLVTKILEKEKIPRNGKTLIIPVHKKVDQNDCKSYRRTAFLDVMYKVLKRIITDWLIITITSK